MRMPLVIGFLLAGTFGLSQTNPDFGENRTKEQQAQFLADRRGLIGTQAECYKQAWLSHAYRNYFGGWSVSITPGYKGDMARCGVYR